MICPKCGNQINDYAKFCEHCGNTVAWDNQTGLSNQVYSGQREPVQQVIYQQVYVQQPVKEKSSGIHNLRLIIGIISVVLFFVIEPLSCGMGLVDALKDKSSTSGVNGIFIGLFILVAGILSIAARKSLGGTIVAILFFLFAILLGIRNNDTMLWALISILFFILLWVSAIIEIVILNRKKPKNNYPAVY